MFPRLALLFCLVASSCLADRIEGITFKILSGDRLVIKDAQKKKRTIRLSGIEAPHKGHAFFQRAKKSLSALLLKKRVVAETDASFLRCTASGSCIEVGRVVRSDGKDAGLEQLKKGMAWLNEQRLDELSTPDRTLYGEAQSNAQKKATGLWRTRPPSEWK